MKESAELQDLRAHLGTPEYSCLADSKPSCVCPHPIYCFMIWYDFLDAYLHRSHLPAWDPPVSA